jgi:hypothetical protein
MDGACYIMTTDRTQGIVVFGYITFATVIANVVANIHAVVLNSRRLLLLLSSKRGLE